MLSDDGQSGMDTCLNCGQPLSPEAAFCPNCGQKRTDGRVTLASMIGEFFDSLFNINARFLVTLRHLFIPGKLTVEYFRGRHKSYLHPLRLLLGATILLITAISFRTSGEMAEVREFEGYYEQAYAQQVFSDTINQVLEETRSVFPEENQQQVVDTISNRLDIQIQQTADTIRFSNFNLASEKNPDIAIRDFYEKEPEALLDFYGVDDTWSRIFMRQKIKFISSGTSFVQYVISHLGWLLILMLPVLAGILKLFYVRRSFYYVEHLVFTFHLHALLFLILSLILFLSNWLPSKWGLLLIGGFGIYIFLAMRTFYGQSFIKTLLKFFGLSILYWWILFFCMLSTLFLGFILF